MHNPQCLFCSFTKKERCLYFIISQFNDRNEAGILTARKDLDYIGQDELLEALKRVGAF